MFSISKQALLLPPLSKSMGFNIGYTSLLLKVFIPYCTAYTWISTFSILLFVLLFNLFMPPIFFNSPFYSLHFLLNHSIFVVFFLWRYSPLNAMIRLFLRNNLMITFIFDIYLFALFLLLLTCIYICLIWLPALIKYIYSHARITLMPLYSVLSTNIS